MNKTENLRLSAIFLAVICAFPQEGLTQTNPESLVIRNPATLTSSPYAPVSRAAAGDEQTVFDNLTNTEDRTFSELRVTNTLTNSGTINVTNDTYASWMVNSGTFKVGGELSSSTGINNEKNGNISAGTINLDISGGLKNFGTVSLTSSGISSFGDGLENTGVINSSNSSFTGRGFTSSGTINAENTDVDARFAFNNSGSATLHSLAIGNMGAAENSGLLKIATSLTVDKGFENKAGGTLSSDSASIKGALTNGGTVTVNQKLTAAGVTNSEGNSISAGTVAFTGNVTNAGNFSLSGDGSSTISGDVNNEGSFTSDNNQLSVTGGFTSSGKVIADATAITVGKNFENTGNTAFSDLAVTGSVTNKTNGVLSVTNALSAGTTLTNESSSTITTGTITIGSDVTNAGILNINNSGESVINGQLINTGTISGDNANLKITGKAEDSGTSFDNSGAASFSSLETSGSLIAHYGSELTVENSTKVGGVLTVSGKVETGTLTVASDVNNSGKLFILGSEESVISGNLTNERGRFGGENANIVVKGNIENFNTGTEIVANRISGGDLFVGSIADDVYFTVTQDASFKNVINTGYFTVGGTLSGNDVSNGNFDGGAEMSVGKLLVSGTFANNNSSLILTSDAATSIVQGNFVNTGSVDSINKQIEVTGTFTSGGTIKAETTALSVGQSFENTSKASFSNIDVKGSVTNESGATITTGILTTGGNATNAGTLNIINSGDSVINGRLDNTGIFGGENANLKITGAVNNSSASSVITAAEITGGDLTNVGKVSVGGSATFGTISNSGNVTVAHSLTAGQVTNDANSALSAGTAAFTGTLTNNGTIDLTAAEGISTVTGDVVNSGTLSSANKQLNVSGNFSGSGTVNAENTALSIGQTLQNTGDLSVSGLDVTGLLTNQAGATITTGGLTTGTDVTNGGTLKINNPDLSTIKGKLDNTGTFGGENANLKISGVVNNSSASSLITAADITGGDLTNHGTINVGQNGTFGAITNTGTVSVKNNLTAGVVNNEAGSTLSAGTIGFTGTLTNNGKLNLKGSEGSSTVTGDFINDGTLTSDNKQLEITGNFTSGGTVIADVTALSVGNNFENTGTAAFSDLSVKGSIVNKANGDLTVTNALSAGTTLTNESGAAIKTGLLNTGSDVINDGTLTINNSAESVIKGQLINTGSFGGENANLKISGAVNNSLASSVVTAAGIRGGDLTNDGSINVGQNGTFGTVLNKGTVTVAEKLTAGTVTNEANSSLSAGSIDFQGTLTNDGKIDLTGLQGSSTLTGDLLNSGTISSANTKLEITGKVSNTGASSILKGLQIEGGDLANEGSVEIATGSFGSIANKGTISVAQQLAATDVKNGAGNSITAGTASFTGKLINDGTLTFSESGDSSIGSVQNNGTIQTAKKPHSVVVNGDFTNGSKNPDKTAKGDFDVLRIGGNLVNQNQSTLTASNLSVTGDIVNDNASVETSALTGKTLHNLAGSLINSDSINISGNVTNDGGAQITVNNITGDVLTNGGTLQITQDGTFGNITNGGTLSADGKLTGASVTIDEEKSISAGTVSFTGELTNNGTLTLTGSGDSSIGVVQNNGTIETTGKPHSVLVKGDFTNGSKNPEKAASGDFDTLSINGNLVNQSGSKLSGNTISVKGNISNNDASLITVGNISGKDLNNTEDSKINISQKGSFEDVFNGGEIQAPSVIVTGGFTNGQDADGNRSQATAEIGNLGTGGDLTNTTGSTLTGDTISVTGNITNNDGSVITAGNLSGKDLNNTEGSKINISQEGSFEDVFNGGEIHAPSVVVTGGFTNGQDADGNKSQAMAEIGNLGVGGDLTNTSGSTLSGETINVTGNITNNENSVITAKNLNGKDLNNTAGSTVNIGEKGSFEDVYNGGTINAADAGVVISGSFTNGEDQQGNKSKADATFADLNVGGDLTNTSGSTLTTRGLDVGGNIVNKEQSVLTAEDLTASSLRNLDGSTTNIGSSAEVGNLSNTGTINAPNATITVTGKPAHEGSDYIFENGRDFEEGTEGKGVINVGSLIVDGNALNTSKDPSDPSEINIGSEFVVTGNLHNDNNSTITNEGGKFDFGSVTTTPGSEGNFVLTGTEVTIHGDGDLGNVESNHATIILPNKDGQDITIKDLTGEGGLTIDLSSPDTTVDINKSDNDIFLIGQGNVNDAVNGDTDKVADQIRGEGRDDIQKVTLKEGLVAGEVDVDYKDGVILSKVEKENTLVKSTINIATTQFMFFRSSINDVAARLGDLRSMPKTAGGWARYYGGKTKDSHNSASEKYNTLQLGFDTWINDQFYAGASFSYSDGSGKLNNGKSDDKLLNFGLYGGWLGARGQYVDVIVKRHYMKTDYHLYNELGRTSANFRNWGTSASVEAGMKFNLASSAFYLEPQFEVMFGHVESAKYRTNQGVKVKQDPIKSVVGRVGVAAGYDFAENKGTAYFKTSVLHDWKGSIKSKFSQAETTRVFKEDASGTWTEFAVGGTYNPTKHVSAYAELKTSAGSPLRTPIQGSIGVRYSF